MVWYQDDDLWETIAPLMRSPEALVAAADEVGTVTHRLGIPSGARVLDLGSGPGAHALAFAERHMDVTAVDRTASSLQYLATTARQRDLEVEVVQREMVHFRRPDAFDLVWISRSLGLTDSDEHDSTVLRHVHTSLTTGGRVVIRTRGKEAALDHLPPRDWSWIRPGVVLLEENEIDQDAHWLSRRLTVAQQARIRKFETFERLYAGSELRRMLTDVGFSSVLVSGDLAGQPLRDHPTELVVVAER